MMEAENPCSPASQSPECFFNTTPYRLFAVDHSQIPSITHLHTLNQGIESAFSRLTLSPVNRSQAPPPPLNGSPSTVDAVPPLESYPLPIPFGENQHSSYWARAQSSDATGAPPFPGRSSSSFENQRSSYCFPAQSGNAIADGPYGFPWAYQNINVGPGSMWVTESNPYFHVDDRDRLMNIHQRQDFNAADSADFDYSIILHGKEQISRNTIPILPFAQQQQGNFGPSLSSNPQLYNWHQELNPEIMRGRIVSLAKDQKWSSLLNSTLEEGLSEQQIEMILPEVLHFSSDLLSNQFGSQFFLKLFAACNEDQRNTIIISLISYPFNFINLCLNTYGYESVAFQDSIL